MDNFNQERFNFLLKLLYDKFPCGGPFHIVTDDGNFETTFIVWCLMHYYDADIYSVEELEWLKTHENDMSELMEMLLDLPEDDRFKINWIGRYLNNE